VRVQHIRGPRQQQGKRYDRRHPTTSQIIECLRLRSLALAQPYDEFVKITVQATVGRDRVKKRRWRKTLAIRPIRQAVEEFAAQARQPQALNDSVGGFGNLLMFGQGGFLDHADTVANISLFAKEVLPRLLELNPTPARAEAAAAQ
jgi:hypothetical protein